MVPGVGLEPTRPCGQRILSPLRLPISPSGPTESTFIVRTAPRDRLDPGRALRALLGWRGVKEG